MSHPATTSREAAVASASKQSIAEQHKAHATQVLALEEQLQAGNVKVERHLRIWLIEV